MLHFAVAGCPLSCPKQGDTVAGLHHAHSMGITAMELEWVQSVPKDPARMKLIRETAEKYNMYLTVHAPYFINLNSPEKAKLAASKKRIWDALSMAELAGVKSVCVHAAFNLKQPPEIVYANVRDAVEEIMDKKGKLFSSVNLGLETMGKHVQFGTLDEVLKISKEFDIYPTIDPAHMHARANGGENSTEEWNAMLDTYVKYLGKNSLNHMHLHYSGIEYTEKGEKKHLPLKESDANWKDFIKVLKDRKVGGTVVCESPILEEDTMLMRDTYAAL